MRFLLAGADVVLPDRIAANRTIVLEGDRIVDLLDGTRQAGAGEQLVDLSGCVIVPGFIDVHVHGVQGVDTLDGGQAIRMIATRLPRFGVTAFCPTTIACAPDSLSACLADVGSLRTTPVEHAARVLPAHIESSFISAEYCGAQPVACLRTFPGVSAANADGARAFSGADVLEAISRHRADVGIVTIAPEIEGGFDVLERLVSAGVRVSLGHSGATYEQAVAAIGAGACHATHLFNRMRPMTHRDPGVVGAILASEDVAAEIICDGHHVHPAIIRSTIAAKGPSRMMAITDGTAGSGLPAGSRARLGGQSIRVEDVARLDDGTIAGSVLTMDRAFGLLVAQCGVDLVGAAQLCSTTPARQLGLDGLGTIVQGAMADLTVLDANLRVRATWVAGRPIWDGTKAT